MSSLSTDLFVLCDHAIVSQEQKLSVIGIFDRIFVENLPTVWPRMFLVAVLKGEAGKQYDLTLKLEQPEKTDTDFPEKKLTLTLGPNGKANLLTVLDNFPIKVAGLHKFQIFDSSEIVGESEFIITKTTPTYTGQDLEGKKVSN